MVVVDSSGWIEYFRDGPKADLYARYLKDPGRVITPAIVIYEVYKKLKRELGDEMAGTCLTWISKTWIVPVDQAIALMAAELSIEFSLAMADALVLATSRMSSAELVTSDADFRKVPGVRVL